MLTILLKVTCIIYVQLSCRDLKYKKKKGFRKLVMIEKSNMYYICSRGIILFTWAYLGLVVNTIS